MAKVYLLPNGFDEPKLDINDINSYKKSCNNLTEKLKSWCIERNPDQEYVGEIIKCQVADGYAEYMVATTKPVQLIHLPYWDKYQSENAVLMTAKAIKDKVNQKRAMDKLFSK